MRWRLSIPSIAFFLAWSAYAQVDPDGIQWLGRDVGEVGIPGNYDATNGTYHVEGSGADIWGVADGFHFVYVPWDGDVEFVARVREVQNTDPWAKAGLMIRADLTPFSAHAMIAMTPEKGSALLRRLRTGGSTKDDAHQAMRMVAAQRSVAFQQRGSGGVNRAVDSIVAAPLPKWIRLVRSGDTISAYDSSDGATWEWLGTERMSLPPRLFVGLAVTSHDHSQLCVASFDQVRLGQPAVPPRTDAFVGTGDGLQGTYYSQKDFTGEVLSRVDATVDFDWVEGSPVPGMTRNHFAVRWEGELQPQFSEPYALHVVSDDRARLWLDGELIVDEWHEHAESMSTAVVNVEAGRRYVVRLEYFENRGQACAKLLWSSPSTAQQAIPKTQLYSLITAPNYEAIKSRYAEDLDPLPQPAQSSDLPSPWIDRDVGRVGRVGLAQHRDGLWSVSGAGADIWANGDGFHFVYQSRSGDVEIKARIMSQRDTDPWAKAGLMLREGLSASARHVMLAVTPRQGAWFLQRHDFADLTTQDSGGELAAPCWIKLVRKGNIFTAWVSADGFDWNWVGTERMDMPETLLVGLVVNSHDNSALGTAAFDNVQVVVPSANADLPANVGTGQGLRATYFDGASGNLVSRIDTVVDFDWDTGEPAVGIASDQFSARWEGFLEAPHSGLYAIHVESDDGARLWLNGELVIDGWSDRAATQLNARRPLQAGVKYPIKLEFYERSREAVIRLLWSSPSTPKRAIPSSQLYTAEMISESPGPSTTASTTSLQPAGSSASGLADADVEARIDEGARAVVAGSVTGIVHVAELPGRATGARSGRWGTEAQSIFAIDRRGYLEYEFLVPAADVYQLEIEGGSHDKFDLDRSFHLLISVDGEYLEKELLDAGFEEPGVVRVLMPWLKAGAHRVGIYWDNARKGRSLELMAVRLQALQGPDADQDGVKDWVEEWFKQTCGTDRPRHSSGMIYSATSPVCLEGSGRFLSMMRITDDEGKAVAPQPAPGDRWYANVPLSPGQPTRVSVSYQNGGYEDASSIEWQPTNLLTAENMTVREGDSVLFGCHPDHTSSGTGPDGMTKTEVDGLVVHTGDARKPYAHRFDRPGTFEVKGTYTDSLGATVSNAIRVHVVAAPLGGEVVAWVGNTRVWECANFASPVVVLDADPRLKLTPVASSDSEAMRFLMEIDEAEPRYLVARLGRGGPIVRGLRIRGFRLSSGSETNFEIVNTYDDGTDLIEMGMVLSPVLPQVAVEVKLIVGGVVFEDGTVIKRWTAGDFDPLGEATVRFLRPALAKSSVCHKVMAWQGAVPLRGYR